MNMNWINTSETGSWESTEKRQVVADQIKILELSVKVLVVIPIGPSSARFW